MEVQVMVLAPLNSRNVTQWSYEYVLNRNKTERETDKEREFLRYPKINPSFMILILFCC